MQEQTKGKNPKGNVLCLNVAIYIYISRGPAMKILMVLYKIRNIPKTDKTLGHRHSGRLLFNWIFPREV